ncbi:helix-turn-helix transcriptional regulator [Catellatospora sp. KI3]|uniref:helix-turn-helix domain-containing protein n=1 Tax=Catellatospora sp. KI3 TaxID=3041620 RepID=UPI0024832746|nr:helix-turn-helix transcriptional regulator [Catellatospora sp. KI3]MDI1465018.1 helix-turn-helix transcriptional regulator [Catellatospora sp. KI3]
MGVQPYRESLGALIASRRRELGQSQDRLADQLCAVVGRPTFTKNEISRYEREERLPTGDILRALAEVLGLSISRLEAAAALTRRLRRAGATAKRLDRGTPSGNLDGTVEAGGLRPEEVETERRELLRSGVAASLVVAGWPVSAGPHLDLPRRITLEHAAELRDTTSLYRTWVSRHGGGGLGRHVSVLLERAAVMHSAASGESVRQALLERIADIAGLGAYVARDVEDHDNAQQLYGLALQAARAAGDPRLGGHLIARMAGHNIEMRRPDDTLDLLDGARRAARSVLGPAERANQLCIEAWANAQRGDAQAVARSVGQAEEEFSRAGGGAAHDWGSQHVTEAELYSLTGAAHADLARSNPRYGEEAVRRLRRAISLRDPAQARNRTLDLVSLAEVLAVSGDRREATVYAGQAVANVEAITSARLNRRIVDLSRLLGRAPQPS